ncbi:hypothetical protein Taro_040109 [Colocasia esculenta]|uniref:Uncharacterized protein n=1 Tax=Colocasia esculenta TaxID=4460 RepID=A0A843WP98_COLES|nr:hypothetical protein [Colocasia esculenta]
MRLHLPKLCCFSLNPPPPPQPPLLLPQQGTKILHYILDRASTPPPRSSTKHRLLCRDPGGFLPSLRCSSPSAQTCRAPPPPPYAASSLTGCSYSSCLRCAIVAVMFVLDR